jgi:hypothetical protein
LEKYQINVAGVRRPTISKTEAENLRRTKVNLSKEKSIEAMSPHMWRVQSQLLQSKRITVVDMRKETIKTEDSKPLLDASQLVRIS